jgi:hypothetical protein
MELYDSCVVVFDLNVKSSSKSNNTPPHLLAIPAVRVLSGRLFGPAPGPDPEKAATSTFIPKGNGDDGYDVWWRYWIPLDSGRWLFFTTLEGSLDIRGQRSGDVMSNAEVTDQLAAGRFNIGLKRVEDVNAALDVSRRSFRDLQGIFTLLKEKGGY